MSTIDEQKKTTEELTATPNKEAVAFWKGEIQKASKRLKSWREEGGKLVERYEAASVAKDAFNILYSNTETLSPALYNNPPRPFVQRRHKDEDPLGKISSDIIKRALVYLSDNEMGEETSIDDCLKQNVLEALVPGQGITWFKYKADMESIPAQPATEISGAIPETTRVTYETVVPELVPWNQFLMGYAKTWKRVSWVGREHFMSRDELVENFGEVGRKIPLDVSGESRDSGNSESGARAAIKDAEGVALGYVVEIWDKSTRKVYFVAPSYCDDFVKQAEDPLQLEGFFPCPEPLKLFHKISSLVPTPLYKLYEEQAKELDLVSQRIMKLIRMLKVRGFYDSALDGLDNLLNEDDGKLIAVSFAQLQPGQNFDNSIWLMPLEKIITVLQQLFVERQQTKQVIYEITGISDILRGSTAASESATAQQLKNSWGTLRLKRMQKLVSNYCRQCLRIMAEISVKHFSASTFAAMTGLHFPTAEVKAQAAQLLQVAQMAGQQPPQEALKVNSMPTWEDILGLLRDDLQRNYRIDVETNSTIDAEASEDKQDMGELLNAIAQFFNGIAPLLQQGILPFQLMKTMLLTVVRRYKFGVEVEDQLNAMQQPAPQPQGAGKAEEASKAASAQAEQQIEMQELAAKQKLLEQETALKEQELAARSADLRRKEALAELEFEAARKAIARKNAINSISPQGKPGKRV